MFAFFYIDNEVCETIFKRARHLRATALGGDQSVTTIIHKGYIMETHCYICRAPVARPKTKSGDFFVNRCNACGLIWAEGVSEEIVGSFYGQKYFNNAGSQMGYKDYIADEKNHRKNARRILDATGKIKDLRNAEVLDIGCAFGFLLDEAKKAGADGLYGVEISSYASGYAKDKLGLKNITANIMLENFEPDFFDAVFLVGTIEHLISPKEVLNSIKRVLKEDGILIITTIDTKGTIPLYSIKPPEHIFYFNHDNLSLLLKEAGLEPLSRKTYYVSYYLHDLVYRLGEFLSMSFIRNISSLFNRCFTFPVRIPTNEMIIIAKKQA